MKPSMTTLLALSVMLLAPFGLMAVGSAQDAHQHDTEASPEDLEAQIAELRALVMRLESALTKEHSAAAPTTQPTTSMNQMGAMRGMSMGGGMGRMSMGGDTGAGGMSMGGKDSMSMGGMGGMSMGDMQAMPMMDRMMMMGMSRMGAGMQGGSTSSALPGFPGASHIYHIGATGFFIDHAEHIALTVEQQRELNATKERTLLAQATMERQIEQAEQDLWTLTASATPAIQEIETKVREIERLRGDQRIAFIRAVGDAATILSEQQRMKLVGDDAGAATQPDNSAHQH